MRFNADRPDSSLDQGRKELRALDSEKLTASHKIRAIRRRRAALAHQFADLRQLGRNTTLILRSCAVIWSARPDNPFLSVSHNVR